jgi:hypothetical protein
MKKRKVNALSLNKKMVSNLSRNEVTGGWFSYFCPGTNDTNCDAASQSCVEECGGASNICPTDLLGQCGESEVKTCGATCVFCQ